MLRISTDARMRAAGILAAACAISPSHARADIWTWTGIGATGGNVNWSAPLNWTHVPVGTVSPTPISDPSTEVVFAGSTGTLPNQDIANPLELNILTFSVGASPFLLGGDSLEFVTNPASVTPSINQNSANNTSILENVTLGNNTTVQGAGPLSINGNINGGGALIDSNTSTVLLAGANTYSGGTTLNAGTLSITSGGALGTGLLTLNSGEINAVNSTTLTQTFTDPGTGNVVFSAATGATLVLSDTLGTMTTSNNLTFGSPGNAGTVEFAPENIKFEEGFSGTGSITVADGTLSGPGGDISAVAFAYNIAVAAGATLNLEGASGPFLNLTGAGTVQLGTNSGMLLTLENANLSGTITGSGNIATATTSELVVLSGSNNYTGVTTLGGGTVGAGNNNALSSGAVTVIGSTALYAAGADRTLNNPITINAGQILTVGDDPSGAHTLTLSGAISGGGALDKTGVSILVVTGAQSITGGYDGDGGTLEFFNANLQPGAAGITAEAGATIAYGGNTSVTNTSLLGPGTQSFFNGFSATDVTVASGAQVTQIGGASLTNFTNGGNFTSTGALGWNIGSNAASGVLTINGSVSVTSFTNDGVIQISPGATLFNTTPGSDLFLAGGSRMYIGQPSDFGGNLVLQGSTTLEVNGALLVNNGAISGVTDVNFGSFAEGTGIYGAVGVTTGGIFQPGYTGALIANNSATVTSLSGNGVVDNYSAGGNVTLTINTSGSAAFSGNIRNSTGTLGLSIAGSGTQTLSGANTYAGPTNVSGGTLVIGAADSLPDGTLNISSGGKVQLASGIGGVTLQSLSISEAASFDVTNNRVFIDYGASDPIATIAGYIASGFSGGAWNGPGINSSALAGNPGYGLGYADGADGVVVGLSSGQIEIKYTLLGDANLDGVVNGDDFTILAGNLGKTVSGWDQGDFNYGGVVNGDDFTELVANLGKQSNGASVALPASDYAAIDAFAEAHGLMADVPEPGSMGIVAVASIAALVRRRRRSA